MHVHILEQLRSFSKLSSFAKRFQHTRTVHVVHYTEITHYMYWYVEKKTSINTCNPEVTKDSSLLMAKIMHLG